MESVVSIGTAQGGGEIPILGGVQGGARTRRGCLRGWTRRSRGSLPSEPPGSLTPPGPPGGDPPALARTYLELSREAAAAPRSPPRAAAAATAAPPATSPRRDVTGSEGKGAGGGSGAGPGPGRRRPRGAHERVPGRDPAGAGRDLPAARGLRLQRSRWVPPAGGTGGARGSAAGPAPHRAAAGGGRPGAARPGAPRPTPRANARFVPAAPDMAAESTGAAPAAVPACLEGKGPGERAAILHQHLGRREMTDVIIETIQPRAGTGRERRFGGTGGGPAVGTFVPVLSPARRGGGDPGVVGLAGPGAAPQFGKQAEKLRNVSWDRGGRGGCSWWALPTGWVPPEGRPRSLGAGTGPRERPELCQGGLGWI